MQDNTIDPIPTSGGFGRWKIVAIAFLATGGMTWAFWSTYKLSDIGLLEFLRATGRVSFLIFLMSFLARPLYQIHPSSLNTWLFANRRYTGLAFTVLYLYHAAGIFTLRWLTGDWGLPGFMLVYGLVAYGFLALMTLTSYAGLYRILPSSWWNTLHTTGMYVLWAFFQMEFLSKAQETHEWYYWYLSAIAFVSIIIRSLSWKVAHSYSSPYSSIMPSTSTLDSDSSSTASITTPSGDTIIDPDATIAKRISR